MQQLLRVRHHLNFAEWFIVIVVPAMIIVAIRYVAVFYIGLAIMLIILAYCGVISYEYLRLKKVNKRRRKHFEQSRFHSFAMIAYGAGALIFAITFLLR